MASQTAKKRKYDDNYIKFGFTVITNGGVEKPVCTV
jgi:hypothetical protein